MNHKSLRISTSSRSNSSDGSNSSNWEENDDDEEDDIFAPPSSPPPPHLIYFPESSYHAGNKSWQQNNTYVPHQQNPYSKRNTLPQEDEKKKNKTLARKYAIMLRRQIFTLAKTLLKLIFQNNNLLLIANVVNKLWKARASFINPVLAITKNAIFIIKHDGYKNLIKYTIHFIQYHFMKNFTKQQHKHQLLSASTVSKLNRNHSPLTTVILLLATMSHLLVVLKKIGSKWVSNTIRNMGGLDSVVLAVSAIAFTKSIQRSGRVF